jgi:antirestriction protein ArdC
MRNFITGVAYTGSNVLRLEEAAEENEFTSPYWLTYRQACEKNLSVRGQHGTQIIRIALKNMPDQNTGKIRKIKVKKVYTVFNLDQCSTQPLEVEVL